LEQWAQSNHSDGKRFSSQQLCEAAGKGDPLALAAVQRTARYLGLGFANLVTLFSPEMIAFGGGLMQQQQHLFLPSIRDAIKANCGLVPHEKVSIVPSQFSAMVGLIGAARVWYDRFTR
jgi:glucokinase